jgi:hypothetical protein
MTWCAPVHFAFNEIAGFMVRCDLAGIDINEASFGERAFRAASIAVVVDADNEVRVGRARNEPIEIRRVHVDLAMQPVRPRNGRR